MAVLLLALMMAVIAVLWLESPRKPQPVKARRNLLQEELLAAYSDQRARNRWS